MDKIKTISRRSMLFGFMGGGLYADLPIPMARAVNAAVFRLKSGPAKIYILGESYPKTDVRAYRGNEPGPELSYVQGRAVVSGV